MPASGQSHPPCSLVCRRSALVRLSVGFSSLGKTGLRHLSLQRSLWVTLTQLWTQNELCLFGLPRCSCNLCINAFFLFQGAKRPVSLFLTVYKLINGILSSVHRLPASVNTGMDETIKVNQILRSKDEQLGLQLWLVLTCVHASSGHPQHCIHRILP